MKYIKLLTFILPVLFFAGCEEDPKNPEFSDDAVPRIFGWYNTITADPGDTLRMEVQVSPSNNASFTWYLDSVPIGEGLSLEYILEEEDNESILRFEAERNGISNYREASIMLRGVFSPKDANKIMVGFLTRDGSIDDIDLNNLTHLVITSAVVGEVEGQESLVDTNFTNLDIPLVAELAHGAGVYVLLDVTGQVINLNGGGYYADYGFFDVISDPVKQQEALETIIKFTVDNELDGINIYLNNTSEGYLDPDIVEGFFRAVPSYLPEGPNGKFFYTASVPGGWTTGVLQALATIEEVDWVNLHAFRYEVLESGPHSDMNAFSGLASTWLGFGLPAEKIVVGFPAFGLHYFLPTDGTEVTWGNLWQYTLYISYRDILAMNPDANTMSMLDVDDGIYYDGQAIVQEKAQYVIDNEFGGLMMWSLESDSHDPGNSLLTTAYSALGND